jgi:hypothetical protein
VVQTSEYEKDFLKGMAKALVIVMEAQGMHLSGEQRDQVMSCTDGDKLELWLRRAAPTTATSVDDVFMGWRKLLMADQSRLHAGEDRVDGQGVVHGGHA